MNGLRKNVGFRVSRSGHEVEAVAFLTISIRSDVIHQIERHCLREFPREGCGLLAGHGREITRFFPYPIETPAFTLFPL